MIQKKKMVLAQKGGMHTARTSQRVLAAALSVVLVVGLFPSLSWAQGESASSTAAAGAQAAASSTDTEASGENAGQGQSDAQDTQKQAASGAVEVVEIGGEQAEATSSQETTETSTEEALETAAEEETNEALSVYEPLAATPVIIGEGASTSYSVPYNTYYKYVGIQMLYTASEINTSGKIQALAFNVATASSYENADFNIYLGTTTKTSLTKTDALSSSELTLVYSRESQTIGETTGWETITLDTPYEYDATQGENLVVAIYRKGASTYNTSLKYYYASTSGRVISRNTDSSSYADNYGAIDGTASYSTKNYLPNIQLSIETCAHTELTHHAAEGLACGDGNIEYWQCKACSALFSDSAAQNEITSTKAAHTYGEGTQTVAPTCKEAGTMEYTCQVCGNVKTEDIHATQDHHFFNGACDNKLRDGETVCGFAELWDGTTTTEPATDENGVYLIGNNNELAWFMNAATTAKFAGSAKLTHDINMGSPSTWYLAGALTSSSAYSNGYQGTFDGNGHAITINYSNTTTASYSNAVASLFNVIGNNGVVKNVTVKGSLSGTTSAYSSNVYAAGIAAYNYGTIQNCINEASITASSAKSTAYAGGIAAYNYSVIEKCANFGALSGTSENTSGYAYIGGITGYEQANSSINNGVPTITTCYNSGSVNAVVNRTSTSYNRACAGGIIGMIASSTSSANTNCLSTGTVTASSSADSSLTSGIFAGGIAGAIYYSSSYVSKITLTNCYYVENSANVVYNSTTTGSDSATTTACGTATEDNATDASWMEANMGDADSSAWFIDLLEIGGEKFAISFTAENATVQVKGKDVAIANVYSGKTLSFTITPAEGYGVSSVTFNDGTSTTTLTAVDGTYTTGAITANGTVNITTHQHVWNAGEVTTPATCAKEGVTTYSCTVAGCTSTKTEAIAATGKHALTETKEVPATCTTSGTKAYWTCETCNQLFSDAEGTTLIEGQKPETIPALGHDYTKYRDNGDGTHTCICSRCSAEQPSGYDVSATASTTLTAGKTYVIVVDGYAMSCEDADSPFTYWRKGVSYTAGETTIDSTLLWTWGENSSLKSVSTGQYLTGDSYKVTMSDTATTTWVLDENNMLYYVDSDESEYYLRAPGGSIYANGYSPTSEAFYEAAEVKPVEEHCYGTDNKCSVCGAERIVTADSTAPYVSVISSTATEEGTTKTPLYLVVAKYSKVAEGYVPAIGETALIKDSQDASGTTFKALVTKDVIDALAAGTSKVQIVQGTAKTTPELKGDVNASGTLNIVDAQVAYDMSCARYAETTLPLANFLAADVNGIDGLNATDAFAIQRAILFGWGAENNGAGDSTAA